MSNLTINTPYPSADVSQMLNSLLASSVHFYFIYKNYHWNLISSDFYQYHMLFDKHASEIFETIDKIAERIRQMGEITEGNLMEYASLSFLVGEFAQIKDLDQVLSHLADSHDKTIAEIESTVDFCSESKDFATADLLTSFLESHQQMRWFIVASNN
jgi:starvation-inducible DNA-binding protein